MYFGWVPLLFLKNSLCWTLPGPVQSGKSCSFVLGYFRMWCFSLSHSLCSLWTSTFYFSLDFLYGPRVLEHMFWESLDLSPSAQWHGIGFCFPFPGLRWPPRAPVSGMESVSSSLLPLCGSFPSHLLWHLLSRVEVYFFWSLLSLSIRRVASKVDWKVLMWGQAFQLGCH